MKTIASREANRKRLVDQLRGFPRDQDRAKKGVSVTNGTQNLMGALRVAMGMCGAYTIRDFHKAEMVIAPSIKTEGKFFQMVD